jgi:hypothetical protein
MIDNGNKDEYFHEFLLESCSSSYNSWSIAVNNRLEYERMSMPVPREERLKSPSEFEPHSSHDLI